MTKSPMRHRTKNKGGVMNDKMVKLTKSDIRKFGKQKVKFLKFLQEMELKLKKIKVKKAKGGLVKKK